MYERSVAAILCMALAGQLLFPFITPAARGERAAPDLTLSEEDIAFSKNKPLLNETIQINATVWNMGGANATSVRVRFYDGDPSGGGTTIGSDQIIDNVPSNGSGVARVNWSTVGVSNGYHWIYVVVDPTNSISEENETNNSARAQVFINLAPTARITLPQNVSASALTFQDITFLAYNSSDPDGNITACFWSFDDGNDSRGWEASHFWSNDGVYNVTLLVTDDAGGTDTDEIQITIYNRAPIAVAYDQLVQTLDIVTLDSANSTDLDGYITAAKWTLHNGTTLNGKKVTTVYKQDGIYPVQLTVTDDDGATNSTTIYITVFNREPVAKINVSTNHINTSESITFDGYKSYDLDGYISNYTWIFPGGGKEYGVKTTHRFDVANGSYEVTLVVVDDDGAIGSAKTTVRVGNIPPTAVAGLDTIVLTYENITFDATRSFDPDGLIVNYSWDFGDGGFSSSAFTHHFYTNNGVYRVVLIVTDNDGATARDSFTVTVLNRPPYAFFPDIIVDTLQNVSLNASQCHDMDGYLVNFTWELGGGQLLFGPEVIISWTKRGTYSVTLTVRDDDGATASHTFNVTVRNTPPVALFSFSPPTPSEGETVVFNASGSYDRDGSITTYSWNFGDGSFGEGEVVEHVYTANNTFRVSLLVIDDDGGTNSFFRNVTVIKYNPPPVAEFTYQPTEPTTSDHIEFDASASYDPAPGFIRRYEWVWGDGTSSYLSLARTNHRYSAPGSYTVTLTVVDDLGAKASVSKEVTVRRGENKPPVAVIYPSASVQESGKPITLDGTSSYDPDGTIVNYTWDFGDGTGSFSPLVTHVYSHKEKSAKLFIVTLTVTDDQGAFSRATINLTITPEIPPNIRPRAVLTAAPTTVFTNQLVRLSAAGSSDVDGTIPEDGYTWSFGDGELGSGLEVFHRYARPGIYVVLLTVRDNRGATGSATETIYVLNIPPTARTDEDVTTETLVPVWLSGAASYDADGEIILYTWDFGDGTQSSGAIVSHIFYHPGVYTVRLSVTDDNGAVSSATLNVTVNNRPPIATLVSNNATGYVLDTLLFDGSRSSDADGRIVNYTWFFGDGNQAFGSIVNYAFLIPGTYVVTLNVTDDSGSSSVASMNVTIIKRPPPAKPGGAPKGFIPGFETVTLAAIGAPLALWLGARRRKGPGVRSEL
ncbi:MAG: PKD domain-containing protein [Thermoplasmata archaeon]